MKRSAINRTRPTPRRKAPERIAYVRQKPKAGTDPTAEELRHHERLREMGCCVTGQKPVAIHHIMKCPGKRMRRDHRFVVGLIPELHNMGDKSVHMLGSEAAFLREHGVDLAAVAVELWEGRDQ